MTPIWCPCNSYLQSILSLLKRLSLIRSPTPPDALTALLEIFSLLFFNHLYLGIRIPSLLQGLTHTCYVYRSKSDAWFFKPTVIISHKPSHVPHPTSHFTLWGWRWASVLLSSCLRSEICCPMVPDHLPQLRPRVPLGCQVLWCWGRWGTLHKLWVRKGWVGMVKRWVHGGGLWRDWRENGNIHMKGVGGSRKSWGGAGAGCSVHLSDLF